MKNCKACGAEIDDNAVFCPKCGKRQDGKKVCANCGALVEEDAKFCPYCGKDPSVKETPAPQTAPQPNPPHAPVTRYSYENQPLRGKAIGVILTLFFSLIGFILCYFLGDEDCKSGAKTMLIIDVVLYIIVIVIVVAATCAGAVAMGGYY